MRFFVDAALADGAEIALPGGAARHAQVRRVQPGDELLLFDGRGCDWPARVLAVGRSEVRVRLGAPRQVAGELPLAVTLALAMPANERMDTLVEKATELGVARVQPLLSERSVLRLAGERAERKRAHWQAVAEAACEQCGRARVPVIEPVLALEDWLRQLPAVPGAAALSAGTRLLLSLAPGAPTLPQLRPGGGSLCTLSGPEGGLTPDEETAARAAGFAATTLGPRVLRADTAPLAVLAWLAMEHAGAAAA
jgi:16S rRNA (uracil1498-N3)-methyltransferase